MLRLKNLKKNLILSLNIVFLVNATSFLLADIMGEVGEVLLEEHIMGEVGCSHYSRHCKLFCTKCDTAWACRICHNEADSSHELDRFAVVKISCNKCQTVQDKQSECTSCGIEFGKYSCLKCSMFDDNEKGQFHCNGCGLCRMGGGENYKHCYSCRLCLPVATFDEHKCLGGASQEKCPICLEFMHDSRNTLFVPKCLHPLHSACAKSYLEIHNKYKCPVCSRSMVDMSSKWKKYDRIVAIDLALRSYDGMHCSISCNDCNKKCIIGFTGLYLKCKLCGSYNTLELSLFRIPEVVKSDPVIPVISERNSENTDFPDVITENIQEHSQDNSTDDGSAVSMTADQEADLFDTTS